MMRIVSTICARNINKSQKRAILAEIKAIKPRYKLQNLTNTRIDVVREHVEGDLKSVCEKFRYIIGK